MMKFLRSQSQTVLVVVLGVIGLGFLFYGSSGNLLTAAGGHAINDFGRIDGEDLSVAELYDAVRNTRDMIVLNGGAAKLNQPGMAQQIAEEAWTQLLLQREADRLHIVISDQELVDYIKTLPPFQKDGAFSPDLYKSRMKNIQVLLHVPTDTGVDAAANTQATFETLLRNTLRSNAVSDALFTNVHSSAHAISEQYGKYYGPTTVSYVVFDPKTLGASAKVTPAEIETEYKNNPTNPAYRTKEKRKVDYVLLMLSPDQIKMPEDQKKKLKDVLGQRALDFALTFQPDPSATAGTTFTPPDFKTEGTKEGLAPGTTDFFTEDSSPANLPPSPAFNNAAFALTKDNMISKVVELDNGVAVLHLAEIQPSDLRPLDEVKGDIEKQLQQSKGMEAFPVVVLSAQPPAPAFWPALRAAAKPAKASGPGPFLPSWESFEANYTTPDWFRDAKLGIWAHWGPQCAPERGDWYGRQMYIEGNEYYDYHVKTYGHPSEFGFMDVINTWKVDRWDPQRLVGLYKKGRRQVFRATGLPPRQFRHL